MMMADRSIDIRERFEDQTELLETVVDGVLSRLPKAGPVTLSEDSKDGHTAKLQPATKSVIRKPDGTTEEVTLPVIPDVPVHFMGGGGITTTFGLKSGNEGFSVPAALGIDGWHQQGGVQSPGDTRQHALWDAVFIPGIRSDPNKLKGVSPDSTQTRTDDKKSVHDVSHTAITTVREDSAHQVNGMAIQAEKGGSQHVVDAKTIQHVASKILLNC
jgi:hypothetical protein